MTEVLIFAKHDHPCINSHNSSGFVTLTNGTEVHFQNFYYDNDDNFCANTFINGKILIPSSKVLTIQYD